MLSIDAKISEFKNFYESNLAFHNEAIDFFIQLISSLPRVESVTGRVKNYDECIFKFRQKYFSKIKNRPINYEIKDYLTDLIGIRVICLYLDEVDIIRKGIQKYFREIEITDKTGQLESSDDRFGYRSLHIDLTLNTKYSKLPEYKKYQNIRFELQIRTISQEAWSMLDHRIKYKKSIPLSLKRRINRLAALFEIADDEFLMIKEEIDFEEKRINERIKNDDAISNDNAIDVFRFLFIALRHFPNYNFIEHKVDGFVLEILELNKDFTERNLNDAIKKYIHIAEQIAEIEQRPLNPYTKIRYCLYLFNPVMFSDLLSPHQNTMVNRIKNN